MKKSKPTRNKKKITPEEQQKNLISSTKDPKYKTAEKPKEDTRKPPGKFITKNELIALSKLPAQVFKYTPEAFRETINNYFKDISHQPYNVAGLRYYLGFTSSEQWDNLTTFCDNPDSNWDIFVSKYHTTPYTHSQKIMSLVDLTLISKMLQKALLYIESEIVNLLLTRSQVAGIIFYLKSQFDYIEREVKEEFQASVVDIRFTVETEEERKARRQREEEQKKLLS